MLHIRRSVSSAWTQLWCFHCFSWSLSKFIDEKLLVTFHDLEGATGRNIPTQGVKSTCNPMFESISIGFRPKQTPFICVPFTYNGEYLGALISKFRDTHFIDIITKINRWKFQGGRSLGVPMTSIQTFSEVRSLGVTWWPDLRSPIVDLLSPAERIDFFVGDVERGKDETYANARFAKLGYVSLGPADDVTGGKAREFKSVAVDCEGRFIKLVIHRNHMSKINKYNQVRTLLWALHHSAPNWDQLHGIGKLTGFGMLQYVSYIMTFSLFISWMIF